MPAYRSRTTTHGRNMAGARGLWRATGMKNEDFGKPIIAVVNSFTQFVPGHVHLKDLGQLVAREIEKAGGVAKEFNTIAVDDGIAMGHDGMLYSLPSREIIADSVEYMVNAHCADAMVCISNCDKITPGMLMASLRINVPTVFVSGGPMESGKVVIKGKKRAVDLIDAMVAAADSSVSDAEVEEIERSACPTCGSCSGMFTANSMNCLTEALGLALPGNGSVLATHADRKSLFVEAGHLIVDLARRHYEQDDASVLPRGIASFKAFENAMTLDIAMGGSTNTVLHLLAAAYEGEIPFTMSDIDRLSRQVPVLCKVAPSVADVHLEDVHRAGGIMAILGELDRAKLITTELPTVHSATLADALDRWDIARTQSEKVRHFYMAAPGGVPTQVAFSQDRVHSAYDPEYAHRFWQVLLLTERVFTKFRTAFLGKCSPVHFFWGSFDLAVTRFSGRRAPPFAGSVPGLKAEVMREAYSHEVSSAGFWPGGNGTDFPAFYSYAYPVPAGFREAAVQPEAAYFSEALGEFLLPYDAVRTAADPEASLLAFLQSTYEAAARAADWDRAALECPRGLPRVPRAT